MDPSLHQGIFNVVIKSLELSWGHIVYAHVWQFSTGLQVDSMVHSSVRSQPISIIGVEKITKFLAELFRYIAKVNNVGVFVFPWVHIIIFTGSKDCMNCKMREV